MSEPVYVPVADLPMRQDIPDRLTAAFEESEAMHCKELTEELNTTIDALDEAVTDWEDVVADRGRIIRELAEANKRIDGVSAIHRSDNFGFCVECSHDFGGENWPCRTARALRVTE